MGCESSELSDLASKLIMILTSKPSNLINAGALFDLLSYVTLDSNFASPIIFVSAETLPIP